MASPPEPDDAPGTGYPRDVLRERDRIATELQNEVIQRVFALGLNLQGAAAMANDPALRRRVEDAIDELDHVIRIIRDTVFRMDTRLKSRGLRARILQLAEQLSPTPELIYRGPVDGSLHPAAAEALLDVLAEAMAQISARWVIAQIDVTAYDGAHITTVEAVLRPDAQPPAEPDDEFSTLRDGASRAGIRIEVERDPERIQMSWHAAQVTPD